MCFKTRKQLSKMATVSRLLIFVLIFLCALKYSESSTSGGHEKELVEEN